MTSVNNPPKSKDSIRHLAIAGVVEYLCYASAAPTAPLPEQVMLDTDVFALWPIVTAKSLPKAWESSLAEIGSPRLVALVGEAPPLRDAGKPVTVQGFARALAAKSFSQVITNLLSDLADPRRGGRALTALALAGDLPRPPARASVKELHGDGRLTP